MMEAAPVAPNIPTAARPPSHPQRRNSKDRRSSQRQLEERYEAQVPQTPESYISLSTRKQQQIRSPQTYLGLHNSRSGQQTVSQQQSPGSLPYQQPTQMPYQEGRQPVSYQPSSHNVSYTHPSEAPFTEQSNEQSNVQQTYHQPHESVAYQDSYQPPSYQHPHEARSYQEPHESHAYQQPHDTQSYHQSHDPQSYNQQPYEPQSYHQPHEPQSYQQQQYQSYQQEPRSYQQSQEPQPYHQPHEPHTYQHQQQLAYQQSHQQQPHKQSHDPHLYQQQHQQSYHRPHEPQTYQEYQKYQSPTSQAFQPLHNQQAYQETQSPQNYYLERDGQSYQHPDSLQSNPVLRGGQERGPAAQATQGRHSQQPKPDGTWSSYPQSNLYKPSPAYQEPNQNAKNNYIDWPSDRDDEEYRFVSSRLAEVEDSLEPVIRSEDLYPEGAGETVNPVLPNQDKSVNDTLRKEIAYQEEMRRRLRRQQEEIAQLSSVVPPLNLSHASTPREEGVRDSLDISLRSESEDEEQEKRIQHTAALQTSVVPPSGTANTIPSSVAPRLSAQHRAEMTQLLSSLGDDGPELAIDKDLYASSRRSQDQDRPDLHRPQATTDSQSQEIEDNLEFLKKIHEYNEALRAQVQEETWNAHAINMSAGGDQKPKKRSRPPAVVGQRNAGQSAPPDVGRPFPPQAPNQRTIEKMEDFVRRNKSISEQMQRVRSKSYSERYKERYDLSGTSSKKGSSLKHQNSLPSTLSAQQPIHEEEDVLSRGIRAPLGPIQVAPGMTLDLNLHISPNAAAALSRRHGGRDAVLAERAEEWAFVHDPEHRFQPPSPRTMAAAKASPHLLYDANLLERQAEAAARVMHRSPLPPIARQPETSPRRQKEGGKVPENGSYLQAFRQAGADRTPTYREYTLRDYKYMRNIARLGGLGPDLENDGYKVQRTREQRRKQYGQSVHMRNRDVVKTKKEMPQQEKELMETLADMDNAKPTKRQLMLEYMKGLEARHQMIADENSKRPELQQVRPKNHKLQKKVFTANDLDNKQGSNPLDAAEKILNDTEYEKMKRRHEQERAAQESIRQQTESSRSQPVHN